MKGKFEANLSFNSHNETSVNWRGLISAVHQTCATFFSPQRRLDIKLKLLTSRSALHSRSGLEEIVPLLIQIFYIDR